jgi:hypothetical protein
VPCKTWVATFLVVWPKGTGFDERAQHPMVKKKISCTHRNGAMAIFLLAMVLVVGCWLFVWTLGKK